MNIIFILYHLQAPDVLLPLFPVLKLISSYTAAGCISLCLLFIHGCIALGENCNCLAAETVNNQTAEESIFLKERRDQSKMLGK